MVTLYIPLFTSKLICFRFQGLTRLTKVFRIIRNFWAGVLELVEDKLCRKIALEERSSTRVS